LRDIVERFSKVQRLRDIVERFEWVRLYSIRRRRTAWIERFTKIQRDKREWINFAEIAEWCSKEDQSIVPNTEKSAAAFDTLASDLLSGEFEEKSRSSCALPASGPRKVANDARVAQGRNRSQL
jgi:hypothetical protein